MSSTLMKVTTLGGAALLAGGALLGTQLSAKPVGNFPFFLQPYGGGLVNITTQPGIPVNVPIQGSDFDLPNDQLRIVWNNQPPGSTVTPVPPYTAPFGQDLFATFSWTPTLADVGSWTAVITLFDSENHSTKVDLKIDVEPPFAVELSEFTVEQFGAGAPAAVRWQTLSELDNAYFNVYRADGVQFAQAVRMNPTPIVAQGNPFQGASYARIDRRVVSGKTYHYWLEAVDIYGQAEVFGPLTLIAE